MLTLFKQRFFWQFAGGFLLGAVGMVALQPSTAAAATDPVTATATR